ncbi:MAG: RDD family protein [Campylobacter sp.]|nr:RDD family protein [Campylobacter sp.]
MNDGVKLASFSKRMIAFFIDDILVSSLFLFAFWGQIDIGGDQEKLAGSLVALIPYLLFLQVVYHLVFVWIYGATLGKMAMKIKCLNSFGQKPNFLEAFVRSVFRMIGQQIFYIGFVIAFFNPLRQGLHDKLAKTVVVESE